MEKNQSINVRLVKRTDSECIYVLSNEKQIRQVSFNQEKIIKSEHEKWFEDKLKDESCLFFVAEIGCIIIGQSRLEIDRKSKIAIISIGVSYKYQGKGYGKVFFHKIVDYVRVKKIKIKKIIAYIKQGNISSQKFFEALNFKKKLKLRVKNQPAIIFERNL